MTRANINIETTLDKARKIIVEDKGLSTAAKSLLEILVLVVPLTTDRFNLKSRQLQQTTFRQAPKQQKVKEINVDVSDIPSGEYASTTALA